MDKSGSGKREGGGSLTHFVTEQLRRRIALGQIRPGERIPTEQALTTEFGVSRTVVREAVAGLRADGLVEARQGAGVFVLDRASEEPVFPRFRGSFDRFSSIIEALELRTAVEIEAAALAASRSSPAQQMRIREASDLFAASVARGEPTESFDFAFHLSIADATNNKLFREFLESLGKRTIPRSQVKDAVPNEYLQKIQFEHQHIADAICSSDADAASAAMRVHLRGSHERYRGLLESHAGSAIDHINNA